MDETTVAGVSAKVCDEIVRRAERYYQAAWDEYEDVHGEETPTASTNPRP